MNAAETLLALGTLLDGAHLAPADQLPRVIDAAAAELGWSASVYLADYEQVTLVPFPAEGSSREPQQIDSTMAGRAFRQLEPVVAAGDPQPRLWVPLVDGVERLGVMELTLAAGTDIDAQESIDHIRWFAHLVGHLIAAKGPYSDTFHLLRSRRPRTVASELVWSMLPPLTTAAPGLVIAAILEPAHSVAGDVFDYALDSDLAQVAMIDATGHDLSSGVIGAVALSAYRSARRQRLGLVELTQHLDDALLELGSDTYATGTFGQLDLRTGRFDHINAGHLSPLLLRDGQVVKSLDDGRRTLLGLRPKKAASVATEMLEPGDWIVMYTDGVTEARDVDRTFFGLDRFIDTVERCAADGQPAPETLRRIARAILEHQHDVLQDDATMMIVQWKSRHEIDLFAT